MKENEFLDGISNIESDVVERFVSMDNRLQKNANRSKIKSAWLRLGAVAACLALIIVSVMFVQMLRDSGDANKSTGTFDDPVSPENINHSPIIFDATASPEQLTGSSLEFIKGSSMSAGGNNSAPPSFGFDSGGYDVKAKVVKNHPDKYYKLDVSSEKKPTAYRLIQMETIEVIHGENVPKYFLYLIRDSLYVDMSLYDSLLISLHQLGTEKYVLRNATQNRMEYFDLLIFTDAGDHPDLGNIIAFTNGVFDESLWKNESWRYGYQFGKSYLDNPNGNYLGDFVVKRGDSEKTVINNIKKDFDEWNEFQYERDGEYSKPKPVITLSTLNFETKEAQEALAFVEPFKNGVFSQQLDGMKRLIFKRFINGCQTEEMIIIDIATEEVTYSEVRYTAEDMAKMENISAHLSEMAKAYKEQLPKPPHMDPAGKRLFGLNLYAWYAKVDRKLYGVIKTAWLYLEDSYQYYDEAYILYDMSDSTAIEISREDLIDLLGPRNIHTYGELGAKEGKTYY